MIRLLSSDEQRRMLHHYKQDDLFRQWHPILAKLQRDNDEMDAFTLWNLAEEQIRQLRGEQIYREQLIAFLFNKLLSDCKVFSLEGKDNINRTDEKARHSATTIMCVVLTMLMNAVEKGHEEESFDNEPMCMAIMDILWRDDFFQKLMDLFYARDTGYDGEKVVITPHDPMIEETTSNSEWTASSSQHTPFPSSDRENSKPVPSAETENAEREKEKANDKENKPTYIKEQHNNNCQQFFAPVTIVNSDKPTTLPQSGKKPKATKKEKQHGADYLVFSKGLGVTDGHIKVLYLLLTTRGWISTQTKEVDFQRLFSGESNNCEVIWTGLDKLGGNEASPLGVSALYVLFKRMAEEKLITTGNKNERVGPILETHFVDDKGHFLTSVSNVSKTSIKANDYIEKILRAMRTRPNSEDIQRLLQEDMDSRYDKNDRQDLGYRKPR